MPRCGDGNDRDTGDLVTRAARDAARQLDCRRNDRRVELCEGSGCEEEEKCGNEKKSARHYFLSICASITSAFTRSGEFGYFVRNARSSVVAPATFPCCM